MTTLTDELRDKGHYEICGICAHERGWKSFKIGNTVYTGTCGYCGRDEILTPLRDLVNADGMRADVAEFKSCPEADK